MGISAKMAADKPKRFKEIVKGLEEIQKGQNIQNIRKAFEDMGKDIQGTMSVMSAIPGASQETIDKLKGLGDMSGFSAEQIRAFNRTLIQMEVAAHQARPELDKLTDVLDRATAAMQADIEKLNRLEIRPMELNISKLQKEMHPFQDEIKRLEKLIKPLNKEIEDFNDQIQTQERLIRPLNKDIEKLREEEDELNKHYDERSKVLDRVARANEKVIAQQRGQLDIASALSRGDIAGAARATRELQATMAQQRMDDAKAALEKEREDKRLAITTQIEAKEKEIKTINEEIERIQGEIEKRQDTINGYTKLIAAENDKIADKQEQIEGIQRRIEASKEKQLALEERIYKAQLLQSMIATKRQIQEDARRGDREAVQFGLYQLEAQMAVAGTTPEQQASFFEGIPNAAAILQPMLQYQALGMEQIIRQVQSVITPAQQLAEILQQLQVNPGLNEAFNMIINNMKNGVLPSLESVIAKAAELGIDEDVAEEAHRIALELTTTSGATDGLNQNMLAMISDSQQVNGVIGAINAVIGALNLQAEAAANANRVRRQELEAAARVALAPFWAGAAPAKTTASAQAPKPQPPKKKKTPKKKTFGGMISYKGSTERAPGMAMGGKMKKYASGAFVPGTGITDSVPALLTPGEFVVRKSVAEVYGPMLQNLNSQIYPEMQKFAMGGFAAKTGAMTRGASMSMFPSLQNVTKIRAFPTMRGTNQQISVSSPRGSSTMNNANIEYNYSVNVNAQTDASADDIANAVVYKFRRMEARQVKGNRVG
jgi:chromosome segregation ATPase